MTIKALAASSSGAVSLSGKVDNSSGNASITIDSASGTISTAALAAKQSITIGNVTSGTAVTLNGSLLVVSGMRLGEVLNLKLENVDLLAAVLTIEGSKFGKSRLIPVHPSTKGVLTDYISCRKRFLKGRSAVYLFVCNRLDAGQVRRAFYVISRKIGIRGKNSSTGPRLHDFRHLFARNTLLRWHQNGENVEALLPFLSTFLGHVHVADTYWYLTATP